MNSNSSDDTRFTIKKWLDKKSKITKFIMDIESSIFMISIFIVISYLQAHPNAGKQYVGIFKIFIIPLIIICLINSLWISARIGSMFDNGSSKKMNYFFFQWKWNRLFILVAAYIFSILLKMSSSLWPH